MHNKLGASVQRDLGGSEGIVYDSHMREEARQYLIAVPQLGDPNFSHKIVLILHHDPEGAIGLVVNDPITLNLGSFAQSNQLSCHERIANMPVYRGGPVTPEQGWILHDNADVDEKKELVQGLYLSGSFTTLQQLFNTRDTTMRLLLGYAGWGEGQLESELAEGAWITTDASFEHTLLTSPEECWSAVLHDMGIDPASITLGGGMLN